MSSQDISIIFLKQALTSFLICHIAYCDAFKAYVDTAICIRESLILKKEKVLAD